MGEVFKFKQFEIDQSGCAMKINTDGVLLGALTNDDQPKSILDIGTGTGVVAMMLAQRFGDAIIEAVEIDDAAAETAAKNFAGSPFAERLCIYADSFESHFQNNPDKRYDLIVSNPPFHIRSLESPGEKRKIAKHADEGFFERLVSSIAVHLSESGSCRMILPLQTSALVQDLAHNKDLYLNQVINIHSYTDSAAHRQIISLSRNKTISNENRFVIYDELKKYSEGYVAALKDFFTIF